MAQRTEVAVWRPSVLVGGTAFAAGLAIFLAFPGSLIEKLRLLDYGVCAQLPGHMLMPGGVELPLCARNTGIYTGVVLGTALLTASGRWRHAAFPPRACSVALLLLIVVMAADGTNSVMRDLGLPHLYTPTNVLRLVTGIGAGAALAALLLPVLAKGYWRRSSPRPSLASMGELLCYEGAGLAVAVLLLTQWPPLLYPAAIISTLGLLLLLSTLNVVVLTIVLRLERGYRDVVALLTPYGIGLVLSLVELLALAAFKRSILGTL